MKRLLMTIGLMVHGACYAQTDQLNLEKYWKFRNSFREKFVKIGPEAGESLPAGAIKPRECKDTWGVTEDGTDWGETGYAEMHWGDGTIRQGHYLGLLATEYKLLKNNGQDLTGILNELYYALNVINRLDKRAEFDLAPIYNTFLPEQLNGFYLREDIPEDFASQHWGNDPVKAQCVNSAFYKNNNTAKLDDDATLEVFGNSYQNVPSLDQMTSLIVGLALVSKLVDDPYIVDQAKQITNRLISYASDHNWMLIDVNGWPVANGGGDVSFAAYALQEAGRKIITPFISYNSNFRRKDFLYNWAQHCITGFGKDHNVTQQTACTNTIGNSFQMDAYSALSANGGVAGPSNNQNTSAFQAWQSSGNLSLSIAATSSIWQGLLPNTLPSFYNQYANNSFSVGYNGTIGFNLGVASGLWNNTAANNWGTITGNWN